jgi:PIN domain nuclease of toxin-antitoxin system
VKLLIDTHILIAILDGDLSAAFPSLSRKLDATNLPIAVSIASIWEIAIKTRLQKLKPRVPPPLIQQFLVDSGIEIIPITSEHATTDLLVDVPTRDPFDRLLLAQAQVEGMRFVTMDRALSDHPVTFR